MKTSIVILTYNQLHHTLLCIDSIRKYTDKGTYEIITVDNHSTDGTAEWLKNQEDIRTIFNSKNVGFPKGCNQGMDIAQGDNILLLNNDVIVTPNWLSNLETCLYSSQDIGAVGVVTNSCSNFQTIPVHYKSTEEMLTFAEKHNVSNKGQWEERLRLIGFCMLIKKEVVDKIGLLDERFSPGNFEDDDYSFRIRKAGYRLILCKDTFIHHFGSASFSKSQNEFGGILNINRKKFLDKWGFDAWSSVNIHHELINFIDAPLSKKINVLEIGCSSGATLLQIKNKYKNAHVFGIDTNSEVLEITNTFADVRCMDIEKEKLPYEEEFFDYIIMANILEHLLDPWNTLKSLRKYLKKDGEIFASIPNIMHFSTIKNLLNGSWNYDNHEAPTRFFSLDGIQKMFGNANYSVRTINGAITSLNEEDKNLIHSYNQITGKDSTNQYQIQCFFIKARNTGISPEEKTEIKFLLRRIENDISMKENTELLIEMIHEGLNLNTVMEQVHDHIIKKEKVLNQIALYLCENNMFDYAEFFLSKAFKMDCQNVETQKLLKMIEGGKP